jgi:glycosyltransferase involved in cell wall biosynthesis
MEPHDTPSEKDEFAMVNESGGRRAARAPSAVIVAAHAWCHEQMSGAFKIATELAEYLAARGHRVFYVCGTQERAPVNPSVVNGVELWRYPYPRARSPHPANLLAHVMGARRLTREVLRRSPVACINGHSPLQFLGASLAASRNCRRVYSVHSPFAEEMEWGFDGRRKTFKTRTVASLARWIDRRNCRRATVVQCYSEFTAGVMAALCGRKTADKTVVSPGWVDVQRFRPVEDATGLRAALGPEWQTKSPVFLSVRRLEPRMGLDRLVEAAALLKRQGLSFRLLIGGSGSLEDRLRGQIREGGLQDTVHLLGRISDQQLPDCYAAADCFVLPTRGLECFGLIILEAYACGVPVIATPVGAIPELVRPQGAQWLTAGTESQDIADRMAAFLRGELVFDRAGLRAFAQRWTAEAGLRSLAMTLIPDLRRGEDPPLGQVPVGSTKGDRRDPCEGNR